MEATALIQYLSGMRARVARPMTHMEIIRNALRSQMETYESVPMPPILNEEQRKVFLSNIDELNEFLSSEDGSDAVELLLIAFKEFKENREETKEAEQTDQQETTIEHQPIAIQQ